MSFNLERNQCLPSHLFICVAGEVQTYNYKEIEIHLFKNALLFSALEYVSFFFIFYSVMKITTIIIIGSEQQHQKLKALLGLYQLLILNNNPLL